MCLVLLTIKNSGNHLKDVPQNAGYREKLKSEEVIEETGKDDGEKAQGTRLDREVPWAGG